jgi:hypothetical protein
MHKKQLVSKSRAYRLLVERLEQRSMLAADIDEAFFDWSQFDTAEQFDPEAVAFSDFSDQYSQLDESWYFGAGEEEPLPPEPEALLPESVGDDTAAEATADAWDITDPEITDPEITDPEITDPEITDTEITDPEITDTEITDTEITDTEITDTEITDTEITDPAVVDTPGEGTDFPPALASDADTVENVTPVESGEDFPLPLPVEAEPSTLEPPLSGDESVADLDDYGSADAVDPVDTSYDSGETVSDTTGLDPEETVSAQADDGDVPDDTASVDDLQPQAGNEGLSEESASPLPDFAVAYAATSSGSAGKPRAASAPRSAAFSMMSMLGGFSFSAQQDDTADGPIFAGGRRRARR